MESKAKILEIFPTSLYVDILPLGFEHLIEWFDNQEMLGVENNPSDHKIDSVNYGARSSDTYILNKPECENLSKYILSKVPEYALTLGYPYEEYKFTQSWITWKAPGQQHSRHTHSNSIISGIFFKPKPPKLSKKRPVCSLLLSKGKVFS